MLNFPRRCHRKAKFKMWGSTFWLFSVTTEKQFSSWRNGKKFWKHVEQATNRKCGPHSSRLCSAPEHWVWERSGLGGDGQDFIPQCKCLRGPARWLSGMWTPWVAWSGIPLFFNHNWKESESWISHLQWNHHYGSHRPLLLTRQQNKWHSWMVFKRAGWLGCH